MKKIDKTVLNETKYIIFWVLVLSLLMEVVFLTVGKWNYTVALGNLLSGAASVLNFFLMGITVQNAVESDEKSARNKMIISQTTRNAMIFATAAVGCLASYFNTLAVLIPFFFPRIAIALRPMLKK